MQSWCSLDGGMGGGGRGITYYPAKQSVVRSIAPLTFFCFFFSRFFLCVCARVCSAQAPEISQAQRAHRRILDMTDEERFQFARRKTLLQMLPVGTYGEDKGEKQRE